MKTIIMICIGWIGSQCYTFLRPTDYRDSHTGNYSCKEIYKHLVTGNQIVQDTLKYTLTVNKSAIDSMVTLITQQGEFTVKLTSANILRHPTIRCFGKFSTDSIYLTYIPSAGPVSYRYYGKK